MKRHDPLRAVGGCGAAHMPGAAVAVWLPAEDTDDRAELLLGHRRVKDRARFTQSERDRLRHPYYGASLPAPKSQLLGL